MSEAFDVTIVSADRQIFAGKALYLAATTVNGEIGAYAGHIPLFALLKPGQIRLNLENQSEETVIYVSGGFIEIQPKQIIILADEAERAEALNEEKIQQMQQHAKDILQNPNSSKSDYDQAEIMLLQTVAQLAALKRKKGR